ncbi:MAG: GGDEF domain-containing protein [Sphingomicrobium sp.]
MFKRTWQKWLRRAENVDGLAGELDFLRSEVARLQERVRELESLAGEDPLVGLPNRRSFLESLERLIARVARYNEEAAIIFIDVDGLKHINDSCGHVAGDAALVLISQLISESVRKSDLVGRLGGDEFGVLLERTDELGGWQMALRIVERVTPATLVRDGKSLKLSVAVGVGSIKPEDDATAVLSRADEQMYRVKRSSRKAVHGVRPAS